MTTARPRMRNPCGALDTKSDLAGALPDGPGVEGISGPRSSLENQLPFAIIFIAPFAVPLRQAGANECEFHIHRSFFNPKSKRGTSWLCLNPPTAELDSNRYA